ncbi:MAG: hypothetical protein NC938_02905 [Candidatus Omnitrophica bacterium]|nr:hypothetical protein [Candidatus Omnitrophota bacterium]
MENLWKNDRLLFLLYILIIIYLMWNTGLVSDDFDIMARVKGKSLVEALIPKSTIMFVETPLGYLFFYIWYYFASAWNSAIVDVMKIVYIILAFYMIYKFFSIYFDNRHAMLTSFLFLFFPSHDATVYWFMVQYLTLSFAFYLYAYYLTQREQLLPAFLFALAGSFISYGSPIIAVSLFMLTVLNRHVKKGFILLVPNVIYSVYYIVIAKMISIGVDKLPKRPDIYAIAKQFVLQMATFADAVLGPSMWLKIYYAFVQLSFASVIIGILATGLYYALYDKIKTQRDTKLVISLFSMTIVAFFVLSLTGLYPQLAFNLGNRVTIFGSLLVVYLLISAGIQRGIGAILFAVFIFAILGISDHWKSWNAHQQTVIYKMATNKDLAEYSGTEIVFISGNQYSKYGPISNIEFLSEWFVAGPVLKLALGSQANGAPINKRFRYANNLLTDPKNDVAVKVREYINVYDSENDIFFKLYAKDINSYIASLPYDKRHWVELVDSSLLRDMIKWLMPRLKYEL